MVNMLVWTHAKHVSFQVAAQEYTDTRGVHVTSISPLLLPEDRCRYRHRLRRPALQQRVTSKATELLERVALRYVVD